MRAKMKQANLLVEIHTEELPPKTLLTLAQRFLAEMTTRLQQAELTFAEGVFYATPRRLAVKVMQLIDRQPARTVERKGPASAAAFNAEGAPTPACIGFARSCGVAVDQLITLKNEQGEWVGFRQKIKGKTVSELLPAIIEQSLAALPIAKRMRWHNGTVEFVRPVHSVIVLYGHKKIPGKILDLPIGNKTYGHRFHSKGALTLKTADDYLNLLEKNFVIADFEQRKQKIRAEATKILSQRDPTATVVMDENLLNEVTGIVEWPCALYGSFDPEFLSVPPEALISAMQDHQRYFPVVDSQGKLLPHFIVISNIDSHRPAQVIAGNERVLRARLSDAAFFFTLDKKQPLTERVELLKTIVFQHKLGTLFDKAERLGKLTAAIGSQLGVPEALAERAGRLAKTDLCTQLVGEFPELQGTAGRYYALHEGLPQPIADALYEQYLPKFAGDVLPQTPLGQALAIADRLDTLVGSFGIQQQPTGDKDPLGLRRAALGVLRILIEQKLDLSLPKLLEMAAQAYTVPLENKETAPQILNFMQDRLKSWYSEKGIPADVFAAVAATKLSCPYDFHLRILAVNAFKQMPQAEALSIANKRVSHILEKNLKTIQLPQIDATLFETAAEKQLADELIAQQQKIQHSASYTDSLTHLAELRGPVDLFFDEVLVMTDDIARRENRLLLLKKLRELFLHVADIALLQ